DFFDYFIDRFATSPEFRTPRGRSDFAKKVAAYIVLVNDLVLRETIINNVSSRLEIPATQLAGLLKPEKPSSWAPKEEEEMVERVEVPPMRNAVRLLCQVTLSSEAARRWVMAQEWEKFLGDFVDTELLIKMI